MSQAAFENYVPGGRQAASRSGGPAFENYVTGRNLNGGPGGMSNSWDTPFYRNFISGYQSAMDNGSAGSYFLNRKTGIALANQEGVDDSGMRQVVRAGDVYDEGKLVGNVYDQYGSEQADLILGQLWLSGQEQAKGVRIADKRAEVEQDMSARVGRERFDAEVEGIKKEWGDTADWAAPLGGGLGGAAVGASAGAAIGAAFGGVGAVPGALIGGIIGGLGLGAVGAVGAGMNRDELEDAAARGEAQARMLEREGLGGAGFSTRLQTWSMLAGEAANPLKQAVHGAAEVMIDGNAVGDDQSAFYSTNADGTLKRDAVWTGVDVAAGLGGAALQFASPLGRLAFQGQMLGQIGGKTGTLATIHGAKPGKTILMRMGIYSDKIHDIKAIPDKATVAIPNDPTNGGRGLVLLEKAGLLKLKPGTGFKATVKDVVENPKHLQFKELEAAQLPRSLSDVDLAVITMNYVMSAKLDVKKQGLFWEKDDEPLAVMILAAREKDKDNPSYKKIADLFHSASVKQYIADTFKGTIVPAN